MNCDCLQRLERAWKARTTEYANMAGQIVSVSGALTVEDVRAALASKDAGPAGGDDPIQHVPLSEMLRLQAHDKWIEEHAKPALEYEVQWFHSEKAKRALAALPQDAGEPK